MQAANVLRIISTRNAEHSHAHEGTEEIEMKTSAGDITRVHFDSTCQLPNKIKIERQPVALEVKLCANISQRPPHGESIEHQLHANRQKQEIGSRVYFIDEIKWNEIE